MHWLFWTGVGFSLFGLAGLVLCIWIVVRARRAKLPDEEMRATLHRAVRINIGSLLPSAVGLAMLAAAIFLT